MKQVLITLKIDEEKFIEMYFPDTKNKCNYYWGPAEQLNKFDEITVSISLANTSIFLYENELTEALGRIYFILQRAKEGLIELPYWIAIGDLIYYLNESSKDEDSEQKYAAIKFGNFWVWSTVGGAQTFIYTHQKKIYLEIGNFYKWHYRERKDSDTDYIPYAEFIKNYKPILVQEITDEMAKTWMAQCESILNQIE